MHVVRRRSRRGTAVLACCLAAALVACGSEAAPATVPATSAATTVAPTIPSTVAPTEPATTTPATTPATTTPVTTSPASPARTTPATTSVVCPPTTDVSRRESGDPLAMSSLYGKDIRFAAHPCFDRVVVELQGTGDFPGWWVEYVTDPMTLGESEETVFLRGDATLVARLGAWMQTTEMLGYDGPWDIVPSGLTHVRELRMTENWEGVAIWAIGLDVERPFTVAVLPDPPRLVIDIAA